MEIENRPEYEQLVLKKRTAARASHTFVTMCDTLQFYKNMKKRREEFLMFQIPFHIRKVGGDPTEQWDKVTHFEQVILDMRSEVDLANVRLNRNPHTFKKSNCDVW